MASAAKIHLRENLAAAALSLSEGVIAELQKIGANPA
jgi:hypothetical protein